MERLKLKFDSYSDVISEIESLRDNGYSKGGNWSLGEVCFHLNFYFRGSLDGFPFNLPWLIRATFGKLSLWWLLNHEYKPGSRTAPQSVPPENMDDSAETKEAVSLLRRLEQAASLKPSALFGELTVEQWKVMHLRHAAHHLGFLQPRNEK